MTTFLLRLTAMLLLFVGSQFPTEAIAAEPAKPNGTAKPSGKGTSIDLGEKESDARLQAEGKDWRLQKAVVVDKSRPRVLLVGDSILNGYLAGVTKELDGTAYVDAWVTPANQNKGLPRVIGEVLTHGPYDVIHFNLGLHGWQPGRIPEGQFEPLTTLMVRAIRQHAPKAKLIWASTTPVTKRGEPGKFDDEVNPIIVEHNRMAANVMAAENVPINDLYGLMLKHLDLAAGDRFHWKPEAKVLQAKQVAKAVRTELGLERLDEQLTRPQLSAAVSTSMFHPVPVGQFGDGEVVCFVGDSITRGGWYHSFLRLFYLTRYPERKITTFNCGHSGDVAAGVLRRLPWDVLEHKPTTVYLMLGMNDAPAKGPLDSALKNYFKLVDAIQAAKCRVVLVGPSIYEEQGEIEKEANVGKNDALARFTKELERLSREKELAFVPIHERMNGLNLREQRLDPKFTLVSSDRVHPGEVGHFVMAETILSYQGIERDVARIVIDVASKRITQTRCAVTESSIESNAIAFTCVEQALPFVPTEKSRPALELSNFHKIWNREVLQVSGLADGKYALTIDDAEVGEYDAAVLAEGINLAANDKTPQYQRSAEITKLNARRHDIESVAVRGVSFIRYSVLDKAGIDPSDKAAVDAKLKAELAAGKEGFGRTMIERYLEQWGPNYEKNLKLMAELDAKIDELRKPVPRKWKLVRK